MLLIELSFAHHHDFQRVQEDVLQHLQRVQLQPLTYEAQPDQYRLRLAYTAEIAPGAFAALQDAAFEAEIKLKEGYDLIAAVGAGVTKTRTTVMASTNS